MNSYCSNDSCFLSDRKHSSSRRFLLKKKSHLLMFWFSQQLQFNFFSINSQTRNCSMAVCLFLSLQSLVKRFHAHETIFINVSLFIEKHPIVFLGTKRETKEGIVLYGNMTQLLMLCLYNDLPICVILSPACGFISSSSSSSFICHIYTIQKIYSQRLQLEGEETQEATGLMGEPPHLH